MDFNDIRYKESYDTGMFVAFNPSTGIVIAESKKVGDSIQNGLTIEGLISLAEGSGESYIIHQFIKKHIPNLNNNNIAH